MVCLLWLQIETDHTNSLTLPMLGDFPQWCFLWNNYIQRRFELRLAQNGRMAAFARRARTPRRSDRSMAL